MQCNLQTWDGFSFKTHHNYVYECHRVVLRRWKPTLTSLLFCLAEIPWSWTKIKLGDVSIWIKIWKEEIERWVKSGNTIATGGNIRNVNSKQVQALVSMFGSMPYTYGAGRGRHTSFAFPAFHTALGKCCRPCASEQEDSWNRTSCKVCMLWWSGFWCPF